MSSSCELCHRARYKGPPLTDCMSPGSEECLRTGLERAEKSFEEQWAQLNEARAQIATLTERQQKHLAMIRNLSQTVPLDSEVASALRQRGVLVAEVGSLRAQVTILELAQPMLPVLEVPPAPEVPSGKSHCNQSDAGDCDVGDPYADVRCDCVCHRCGSWNDYLEALNKRNAVLKVNAARAALIEAQEELKSR